MRHPRAEQDHAEIDGVLYGSDERAERIELDECFGTRRMDLSLFCRPMLFGNGPAPESALGLRSGQWKCVEKRENTPPDGWREVKKPLTVSSAFIYGAGMDSA